MTEMRKRRDSNSSSGKPAFAKAYGFALVTGALFLLSWTGQFVAQMVTVRNEAEDHGQVFQWADFIAQFSRPPSRTGSRSSSSSCGRRPA